MTRSGAERCEHGFVTCYSCKHDGTVGLGCHYPACEDIAGAGEKYCPKHHGKSAAHFKAPEEDER